MTVDLDECISERAGTYLYTIGGREVYRVTYPYVWVRSGVAALAAVARILDVPGRPWEDPEGMRSLFIESALAMREPTPANPRSTSSLRVAMRAARREGWIGELS